MNEFQVVKSRRKGRGKQFSVNKFTASVVSSDSHDFNEDKCRKQINSCKEDLKKSKFWVDFYTLFCHASLCNGKHCENVNSDECASFEEFLIYGIGSIYSSAIARYQFALVLLLIEKFKVNCCIYDPVLTSKENMFISDYEIQIIDRNEECKRKVCKRTLLLMLHCGKAMYNNLLWSNWGLSLQNIFLIGNCFSSYEERLTTGELLKSAKYLKEIIPFTLEHKVKNNFHHEDIFNDTAIHSFPEDLLLKAPKELWLQNEEPSSDNDTEIITNK